MENKDEGKYAQHAFFVRWEKSGSGVGFQMKTLDHVSNGNAVVNKQATFSGSLHVQ